jgi:putative transposase
VTQIIFQSRRFRAACRNYRRREEFITPYTLEQNGIAQRFFRSFKEKCVWQRNFADSSESGAAIAQWINWYNVELRDRALSYAARVSFARYNLNSRLDIGGTTSLQLTR